MRNLTKHARGRQDNEQKKKDTFKGFYFMLFCLEICLGGTVKEA